ncbi:MAG: 4Fe-4S binding protein, partial [Bacteroidales bacterium]
MAIPTSRTKEKAEIRINEELCTGCGLCAEVCSDFGVVIENGKAMVGNNAVFGCVGCGHCMAVCPEGAIEIHGRTLSPEDLFNLPPREKAADYEKLLVLLQRRRSTREFDGRPVESTVIDKILEAAVTAPMGLPPSDVNVLVLDSKEKNRAFVKDFCEFLETMKWFVSDWFLTLMRPFWGKASNEMFRGFVKPCFDIFISRMKMGENVVTYDAPLVMYFYGSPYTD